MLTLSEATGKTLGAGWRVAVATLDGSNVDGDFDSARSFALFDLDDEGARFVALVGCSTPSRGARAAALCGCDVLLSLATEPSQPRVGLRARVIELARPSLIVDALSGLLAKLTV
jgi:hypothetical protein